MTRAYLGAGIASVLWGTSFLLTKVILVEMGPMSIAAARWWIAGLTLLVVINGTQSGRRLMWQALRNEWLIFVGLGVAGESLFYVFQNLALVFTTSIDVGLIMNAIPILAAILSVWILGERFSKRSAGGLVVAVVGVVLISLGDAGTIAGIAPARLLGNLLALLAVIVGSFYLVLGKRIVTTYGPLVVTALTGIFGALVLTPVAVLEGVTLHLSPLVWAALVVLALGCSGVAYWLWWYAAERLPVSRASAFFFITPIVSTFLGAAVLGEPMTAATLSGAVLVLGGVAVVQT